ncbi:MAG: hypothetical protein V9G19_05100 [Tetrasphaera sp.]
MTQRRIITAVLLMLGTLLTSTPRAPAEPRVATASGDWCTSVRPVSGSVPLGTFHASKGTACAKCDEYARYLRAHGKISTYACAYTYRYPAHATLWARRTV